MIPELLPLLEAGRRLGGVSSKTVRRMIERGDLEAYKIGGKVKVDAASIEEYIEARRIGPLAVSPTPPRSRRPVASGGLLELLEAGRTTPPEVSTNLTARVR